jgi:hypothetical protein
MLRMQNRWLQWLQNVQKPLVGLFLHLVWPKNEKNTLPGSFSPIACCTCSPKHTLSKLNLALSVSVPKTQHAHILDLGANCRMVRGIGTLMGGGYGHVAPHVASIDLQICTHLAIRWNLHVMVIWNGGKV